EIVVEEWHAHLNAVCHGRPIDFLEEYVGKQYLCVCNQHRLHRIQRAHGCSDVSVPSESRSFGELTAPLCPKHRERRSVRLLFGEKAGHSIGGIGRLKSPGETIEARPELFMRNRLDERPTESREGPQQTGVRQQTIAEVTREELVATIALEHDFRLAAQSLGKQEERYICRIAE